jgi:hypothetical protein
MNENLGIGFVRAGRPCFRPGRLVVAAVLTALVSPLAGCSFGRSAGGAGTVDIARSKEASKSRAGPLKGAALRERAGLGAVQKAGRR